MGLLGFPRRGGPELITVDGAQIALDSGVEVSVGFFKPLQGAYLWVFVADEDDQGTYTTKRDVTHYGVMIHGPRDRWLVGSGYRGWGVLFMREYDRCKWYKRPNVYAAEMPLAFKANLPH